MIEYGIEYNSFALDGDGIIHLTLVNHTESKKYIVAKNPETMLIKKNGRSIEVPTFVDGNEKYLAQYIKDNNIPAQFKEEAIWTDPFTFPIDYTERNTWIKDTRTFEQAGEHYVELHNNYYAYYLYLYDEPTRWCSIIPVNQELDLLKLTIDVFKHISENSTDTIKLPFTTYSRKQAERFSIYRDKDLCTVRGFSSTIGEDIFVNYEDRFEEYEDKIGF